MCLGVPGKILETRGDDPLFKSGRVSFAGIVKEVSLACVPEVEPGDWVLVHAGLAIAKIDEEEAQQTLADLRRIIELSDELSSEDPSREAGEGSRTREVGESER